MKRALSRSTRAVVTAAMLAAMTVVSASAHVVQQVGPYTMEIGWQNEPTYVGLLNGVQVFIHDADDQPVIDLQAGDLTVTVSNGSQQTGAMILEPGFDPEEGWGTLGEYDAPIMPTQPGDYTFHLTGTIHDQQVDISVTSGEDTFSAVQGTADIQFPEKLPTLTELVTRIDQVDAAAAGQASVDGAVQAANDARAAADRALLVGAAAGGAGVLVGLVGVWLALRSRRPAG